jgi:hypothetical protein
MGKNQRDGGPYEAWMVACLRQLASEDIVRRMFAEREMSSQQIMEEMWVAEDLEADCTLNIRRALE